MKEVFGIKRRGSLKESTGHGILVGSVPIESQQDKWVLSVQPKAPDTCVSVCA